ncbi:acyl-CoA dehydrogenase family protein [Streptantibioticus ferralitis]|uniref:Acyl-CoA dehydrogenase family protein n=1 Tax=Streptantibioticus ferralitis TaxID=236510 RepID=A0ABT5Z4X5_9ACTN|nr:acyl-CoA dehydrogenase family protein [Streptantibioticus ferralitis]MDF2258828.1 acyl-CoA dehydrogenase family protein [Streptantibioticus ferralitis]
MLSGAREVAAVARALADETERGRQLAPQLVAELKATDLLRIGLTIDLGGTEPTTAEILQAAETIAEGDASAGWCVSIAATSSLLGAYLPEKGGQEVFSDPTSVAAGVWAPHAKGVAVKGGVRITGRWSFCSGIRHSDWIFLGFMQDGRVRTAAIQTAELEILDTWHTSGLRGTGSTDAVANDVFVPDERLLSVVDGPPAGSRTLQRFPLFGFFASSIAAASLGNARGAMTEFVELATVRKPSGSSRSTAERSATQSAFAEAEASLRAARCLFYQAIDDAWQAAKEETPVSVELRTSLRLACTYAVRTAATVVRVVYDLSGSSAIYEDAPLQRRFRDAHTATAHFQVNPAMYRLTGRVLLGLPTETDQL